MSIWKRNLSMELLLLQVFNFSFLFIDTSLCFTFWKLYSSLIFSCNLLYSFSELLSWFASWLWWTWDRFMYIPDFLDGYAVKFCVKKKKVLVKMTAGQYKIRIWKTRKKRVAFYHFCNIWWVVYPIYVTEHQLCSSSGGCRITFLQSRLTLVLFLHNACPCLHSSAHCDL